VDLQDAVVVEFAGGVNENGHHYKLLKAADAPPA